MVVVLAVEGLGSGGAGLLGVWAVEVLGCWEPGRWRARTVAPGVLPRAPEKPTWQASGILHRGDPIS